MIRLKLLIQVTVCYYYFCHFTYKNIYCCFLLASRGVTSHVRQVMCNTTQLHKHKQRWREERDVRFLAGNTVIILSLCQLKMRILRFVVHSVLGTNRYQASKTQHQIWSNIWSRSTAQLRLQSQSHQVVRAASKATASTSAGSPPPPRQQKLDFGAKQVSGGELKKLVGRYVVEEMLHLNTVDSPSFGAIINKSLATINAALGVTVKNALPIKWVLAKLVVIFMLRQRGCCQQLLSVTNKVTYNPT